jgi:hypothetical protein
VLYAPGSWGSIGSPLPLCLRRFRRSWRFLPFAVPCSLAQTGSSSRTLYSPSECYRSVPAQRLPASSSFHGVGFSLFATSAIGVLERSRDSTPSHLSVFGVSHALDGFLRRWPCGFVSPHCHVQGSPFRGFILPHSRPQLVAEVVPSRRLTELRCPQLPASSTSLGPALRAFPLCGNPQSLLRCLAAASTRSPPGLASSRSSLSMPWERLHAP